MIGPFVHVLRHYATAEEFLSVGTQFVREGLAARERVVVAVGSAALKALSDELGRLVARIDMVDLEQVGHPGRMIPSVLLPAVDRAPGRVRVLQEPLWEGRTPDEQRACAQYEAITARAFAGRELSLLCLYGSTLAPQLLAQAGATHRLLFEDDQIRPGDHYDPDWLAAERARPLPEPHQLLAALKFDLHDQHLTRTITLQTAEAIGLPPQRALEAELIVNELAANSIEHGGGHGLLRLWNDGTTLVCEVSDEGHLSDPLAGQLPVGLSGEGGRGIYLTHALADLVVIHTHPGHTVVRAHFTP